MGTRVYGCSDDLVEIDGDIRDEVGAYDSSDEPKGVLLVCSDGTFLVVRYGKTGFRGVWEVVAVKLGTLFGRIDQCVDEDADPYSDQAFFHDGMKWIYACKDWDKIT